MQSINRVVEVLLLMNQYSNGITVTEISQQLNLPMSTTHRILTALKKESFVIQDLHHLKRYRIGHGILRLAYGYLNHLDIRKVAKKYMDEISHKYENLVFLTIMENATPVCVDLSYISSRMRFYVDIGAEMPINAAASAQAILAYKNKKEIELLLKDKQWKSYTEKTLVEEKDIIERLEIVNKRGYAICKAEMEYSVDAIAAPIFDGNMQPRASLTLIGLESQGILKQDRIDDIVSAAAQISCDLGYCSGLKINDGTVL